MSQSPILPVTEDSIEQAARRLIAGELVAFPTETVYGLGADAAQAQAVAAIYRLKGRPADHPLIVHAADTDRIRGWARWNQRAERLAQAFWPGPLTLILLRSEGAPDWACGGQPTIGVRVPAHPVASQLLRAFHRLGGTGVAAPSANRFGRISPTTAQHVLDDLGREAPLILDGGRCAVGLESTIVDLSRDRPALLRPGGIEASRIEAALAEPLTSGGGQAPRVSGSLAAHYAPGRPLELLDARALPARALALELEGLRVAVWSRRPPDRSVWMWRSMPEDPVACGQALFECLRELDRSGADCLLIEQPPSDPRWLAVNDRLGRAAVGAAQLREPEPGPATG